ncbi:MAG: hypothetical protein ABEI57_02125, partial [Halapricum sp.]
GSTAADDRDGNDRDLDPVAVLSALLRIGYSDLVTLVVTSLLTTLLAIPLVTLGGALLALEDTLTTIVTAEGRTSAPQSERARIGYFWDSFRANLTRGVPYSVLLVLVSFTAVWYVSIAFSTGSSAFLLGSVVGLYAVVIVTVWVLRAMSLVVRADEAPRFRTAMRDGWYSLLEELSFTALQAIVAATFVLISLWLWAAIPLLLPGALVLLEIVSYEELSGDGASALVLGYRGELHE